MAVDCETLVFGAMRCTYVTNKFSARFRSVVDAAVLTP